MADSKSLQKFVLLLFIPNWLFGMGAVEYPLGTSHPIKSLLHSLFCIIAYSTLSAIAYPHIINSSAVSEFDNKLPVHILFYSNIFNNIFFIALAWHRRKELRVCISKSIKIVDLMEHIGIPKDYNKLLKSQMSKFVLHVLFSSTVVSLHFSIAISHDASITSKALCISVFCYPIVLMFIADSTFLVMIRISSQKFGMLNDHVRKMITCSVESPQHRKIINVHDGHSPQPTTKKVLRSYSVTIKLIKEVHMMLTKVCDELNHLYGLQNLLSIAVAFGVITGYLYNTYVLMHDIHSRQSMIYKAIASSSIWIVYYINKIYCLTWACGDCSENCSEIGELINELYDEPVINLDVKNQIRNFNIQLLQRPLRFTAFGFIDLNYTLIQSMIGSITTYLMILIQLGNAPEQTIKQNFHKNPAV